MNNKISEILQELNARTRVIASAPASSSALTKWKNKMPFLPKEIIELYQISDGIDIGGDIVLFSSEEILTNQVSFSSENLQTDNSAVCIIGEYSFGDVIAVSPNGTLLQADHETGEILLEWETLSSFLSDELTDLEGGLL